MNLTFSSYYLGSLGYCIIKKSLASGLQRPEFPGEVIINIKDLIHLVGVGLPQVAALIGNPRPSREGINPKTITGGDQPQDHHGRGSTPRPSREGINPKTSTGGDQPQDHHGRRSTKVGWRLKSSTFHTLNYLIWQWPSYTDPPIINTILTSEKIKHR